MGRLLGTGREGFPPGAGVRLAMHSGASKINNKNSFFYNHKQYDTPHGPLRVICSQSMENILQMHLPLPGAFL
ncbi:hypothetical protein DZA01_18665 [Pseudomonas aeruginosa]|nr:hypothetical protein DZA01_18665 [Pseudomonas aeruginosa]